jgi:hypothetical protein
MPNKKNIDEANRERALKLLEESDPELAKLVRDKIEERAPLAKRILIVEEQIALLIKKYRPSANYAGMKDDALLYVWSLLAHRITGCVGDVVARYFNPVSIFFPGTGALRRDVSSVRRWPLHVLIAEFQRAGVDKRLLFCIIKLTLEEIALIAEYERRMASRPLGHELLHPSEIKRLQELLGVEKLQTWRPKKEDSDDLREIAIVSALEKYNRQCADLANKPLQKVPRAPLRNGAQWDILHRDRYEGEVKPALKRLLPVLYGTSESIKGDVHQVLRNHWEQWEAQMRTGEEVDLQEGQKILRREGRIQTFSEDLDERVDVVSHV